MFKKLSYRKKLFLYLTIIFTVFTFLVLVYQFDREKKYKKGQLENELNFNTELIHKFISQNDLIDSNKIDQLDSLIQILPDQNIRITIITPKGIVLYDSEVKDYQTMENHLHRSEVQKSVFSEFGSNIRNSATTGKSYYYFAKYYTDYFIRSATLYDVKVQDFLKAEKLFITYIITLFLILWLILLLLTKSLNKTLTKLKEFTIKLSTGQDIDVNYEFPDDELGTISKRIVIIYKKLNSAKEKLSQTKDKLFGHLTVFNEGIAFFTPDKKTLFTNNHFIHFLNLLSDISTISAEQIFEVKKLKPFNQFINSNLKNDNGIKTGDFKRFETELNVGGKYFNILCIIFPDMSFEIIIKDITKLQKQKLLKQQMTSNIAHELKTPISAIMGYLETLTQNNLTIEKQVYFTEKAYAQTNRLSELIEDISVLNKIEESSEFFSFEKLNISEIIKEIQNDLDVKISENNINVDIQVSDTGLLKGNRSLLYSVFYNLFENAIKYGGDNITIKIKNYLEDENFYYFSFANTGNSIDKKHFSRMFERFYRIDSGRSRKKGGTGLGLAIVKNAIELHSGEITANKNKPDGVEFLFTIAKK